MLDIIANNDWKRPIYFTGGSYSDDEYIWMRDYLQLDGLAYKLVPIRTPIDKDNPYDMGRIDSDLMYKIVKSWDWGNMDDPNIYHDPETRRNSIVFRGNLARLTETLINEGKIQKAKDILDLATKRIPVSHFGYYFTVEPFITGYYQVKENEKARKLFLEVAKKYQENIEYYLTLSAGDFINLYEDVSRDLRRYDAMLPILAEDKSFYDQQYKIYEQYIDRLQDKAVSFGLLSQEDIKAQKQPKDPNPQTPDSTQSQDTAK